MSDPKMKIIYRDPKELIPAEYNPRKLSAKQAQDLRASLTRFGFVDPVLVNIHPERKNIIVGGHQRTTIAIEMGTEKVPTVEVNLTPEQEKELNIRLNKNGGEFDMEKLAEFFDINDLIDFGFESGDFFAREAPEDDTEKSFEEIDDESIETEHECPKCKYRF